MWGFLELVDNVRDGAPNLTGLAVTYDTRLVVGIHRNEAELAVALGESFNGELSVNMNDYGAVFGGRGRAIYNEKIAFKNVRLHRIAFDGHEECGVSVFDEVVEDIQT